MNFEAELDTLLQARFTLMYLNTTEETRALEQIGKLCTRTERFLITWDVSEGFRYAGEKAIPFVLPSLASPIAALEEIEKMELEALFVLKDFDEVWTNAQVKRKLRNVAQRLKKVRKSILVLGCCNKVPDQLKDEVFITEFHLPEYNDIEAVIERVQSIPGVQLKLSESGRDKLVRAALGLSASQAMRAFSKAVVRDGVLDDRHISMVCDEKRQVIKESRALEFFPVIDSTNEIGGLHVLKEWLRVRERAFTEEARRYMLPEPKGIILLGIPGTGKSLTAKAIGSVWRMHLLRLDVGALFGSLVGESEERTRKALLLAETVAPCVLWIDELDKAFASGDLDGGVSRRVFASILTWMQEKRKPCFVVSTANNVNVLPVELLRRGRFDEIFFLDLPTLTERREIVTVHVQKRNRLIQDFDIERLAKASQGYVGAEIEQAIIDGMYAGFDSHREFTTDDVLAALRKQIPLSISQADAVKELRRMLMEGKAQSASFHEAHEARESFVDVNLKLLR